MIKLLINFCQNFFLTTILFKSWSLCKSEVIFIFQMNTLKFQIIFTDQIWTKYQTGFTLLVHSSELLNKVKIYGMK